MEKKKYKKWTKEEIDFLTENYGKYTCPELAKIFGVNCNTLERFIHNRKIKRTTNQRQHDAQRSAFKAKFRGYKSGATNRGLVFELTLEDFTNLTKQNCFYCGEAPSVSNPLDYPTSRTSIGFRNNTEILFNGIDRMDNKIGYILTNCKTCCITCNNMKKDLSTEDFISHIKKLCKYQDDTDLVKLKDE